jgi:hypothetical protein
VQRGVPPDGYEVYRLIALVSVLQADRR